MKPRNLKKYVILLLALIGVSVLIFAAPAVPSFAGGETTEAGMLPRIPEDYVYSFQKIAEDRIIALVNQARTNPSSFTQTTGYPTVSALATPVELNATARYKSLYMNQYNDFSHPFTKGPIAGMDTFDPWTIMGENIAARSGYGTVILTETQALALGDALFTQWLNSTGHRDNFMDDYFTKIGVGVVISKSGPGWDVCATQHFGINYFPNSTLIAELPEEFFADMAAHENTSPLLIPVEIDIWLDESLDEVVDLTDVPLNTTLIFKYSISGETGYTWQYNVPDGVSVNNNATAKTITFVASVPGEYTIQAVSATDSGVVVSNTINFTVADETSSDAGTSSSEASAEVSGEASGEPVESSDDESFAESSAESSNAESDVESSDTSGESSNTESDVESSDTSGESSSESSGEESSEPVVIKYTITYDANGGKGAPAKTFVEAGKSIALSRIIPERDGYTFEGWALDKKATKADYKPGASFKPTKDTTLYAVWTMIPADMMIMRLNSVPSLLNGTKIQTDPKGPTVAPFTLRGKTMVPVRFMENFKGVKVKYDEVTKNCTVFYKDIELFLELDKTTMRKTVGKTVTNVRLATPSSMAEGKTYIPAREVAEHLGFYVKYDSVSYVILVSTAPLTNKIIKDNVTVGKTKLPTNVQGISSISAIYPYRIIGKGSANAMTLTAKDIKFNPANAGCKRLLYASSNTKVATVTSQGRVVGVSKGVAVIIVSSHNGKTALFGIIVD